MTIGCAGVNLDLGVALRLSGFLDCQARALGENGFQSLVGGPVATGLLAGLVTIFVALIGYRLILGHTPGIRDGVTWAARLGFVLALVTSWPAYQTIVYRVAVDAPGQLAMLILPAAGLPSEELDSRVQQAYDTIRLGSEQGQQVAAAQTAAAEQNGQAAPQPVQTPTSPSAQLPLPQTASALVLSTVGVTAALRVAIGFLLAIGPIAVMALLFDATLGIFSGWVRALAGAALATLAATIVTAIDLVMVEGELARLQAYSAGGIAAAVDLQAITTLVLVFALIMLVATLAAARMAGAFRLPALAQPIVQDMRTMQAVERLLPGSTIMERATSSATAGETRAVSNSRVASVADALARTVQFEQAGAANEGSAASRGSVLLAGSKAEARVAVVPIGLAGRRSMGRRSLSAARRDSGA